MKSKFLKSGLYVSAIAVAIIALSSCKKMFDIQPQSSVDITQNYRNVFDADAAVLGVYGKFMGLAKQYVVLNELRADLMSVTVNADNNLRQLSNHSVTADNPYANPTPFYEVILNCNDVLKNFDIMLRDKKLSQADYNVRYSDVASIRSFVYLQLGIHFGSIPYVTDPLANVTDLRNESLFPMISFQQLLKELINTMENLPTKDPYPAGTTLITTVDQYPTNKFFINKNILLGEIYLWNGTYDASSYRKAATNFRKLISTEDNNSNINTQKNNYKIIGAPDPTTGNQLAVQYVRYRETDINSLYESTTEGWRSMFSRGQSSYDAVFNWEWVWVLPFTSNFKPANPFIDLFSNRGGSYLVKPSQVAIDNWNNQVQTNGFNFDARGRFTYKIIDGQPVIMKYLYYYLNPSSSFSVISNANGRTGEWWLYRAASVWQHYAEAANRDGRAKLGYAAINNGIKTTFDNNPSGGTSRDVTNTQQTFDIPPYDFDARTGDNPQYRAVYRDVAGLRGRANLVNRPLGANISLADSITNVENMVLDEGALELAYEGQRWSDLLRVAIRRNDPTVVTSRVAAKLRKDGFGGEAAKVEALGLKDLYLPFKWQ